MALVQADDQEAFAELYDRYAVRAFKVACSVCRDRGLAEDAVQEAYLSLWRSRMGFSVSVGSFKAWSMRTVQNRAIDSTRRASRINESAHELELDKRVDTTFPAPAQEAIESVERDELRKSLGRLPEAQSEVIALAFYGGLSHSEIAAELELPPGTVKGRMRLGLEKLRERQMAN